MNRREFLASCGLGLTVSALSTDVGAQPSVQTGFRLTDVTAAAGLAFRHSNGAYGGKLLPETLGSGCAFIDYDADGWQDIFVSNDGQPNRLWINQKNGTFTGEAVSPAQTIKSNASPFRHTSSSRSAISNVMAPDCCEETLVAMIA